MTSERVLHCQRRRIQPGFRDFFAVSRPYGRALIGGGPVELDSRQRADSIG